MHYSLDDKLARPSECCDNNPNLPSCMDDITSDWCMSVLHIFDYGQVRLTRATIMEEMLVLVLILELVV